MLLTYRYRIYPNKTQQRQLERVLDVACHVYNDMLHTARLWYEADVKWNMKTKRALRDLFCQDRNKHEFVRTALPAATVDALTYRVDGSMRSFFALRKNGHEDARPPAAVARHKFQSVPYWATSIRLFDDTERVSRLRLFGLDGLIRVHYHRPIPPGWKIKLCMITQTKRGEWYAAFQCEGTQDTAASNLAVGIDMGFSSLIATSDGWLSGNPRWYRRSLPERRRLKHKEDRQRRASNPDNYNEDGTVKEGHLIWRKSNRLRETERLSRKMDAKITRERDLWIHTVTHRLTNEYGLIAIEDLSPQFTIHNKKQAVSAHDAAWAKFVQILEYKCQMRGVELVKVNPAYTSQACSGCGEIVKKGLDVRVHRCSCGLEIDRDVNAAKNILSLAINGPCRGRHGNAGQ